jgi:TP901 family phage tail tape measure protein
MALTVKGGSIVWDARIDNDQIKKDGKKTQGILSTLGSTISKADIFAGVAASAAVAFKKVIDVNKEFEKSQSSLQSILGLTKDEMVFFKDAAIELGGASTKTSVQVSEAFKLIGSQKPELLENRDALKSVTEQAIILSEAAEVDVPVAAKALTNALNQMGEGADQASRFINVLAAGSKVGAADIPFLNAAIEKSGAVARDANLSFEELVAGLETLAPSISEPTTAGLQFRDVLLRLQKAGKGYESGSFDLRDALDQVKQEFDAIQDPVAKAKAETDLFGQVSLVAGKALLNNTEAFDNYATAVEGTNTALEQQAINTDNLDGDIARFNSAVEALILSLNSENGLTGSIRLVVNLGTALIDNMDSIIKVAGAAGAGFAAYKATVLLTNFSLLDLSKGLALARKAMLALNVVAKANPLGLMVAGLTAATFAFAAFRKETSISSEAVKEFSLELGREKHAVDEVFEALKKSEEGTKERNDLINQINITYSDYLPNLLSEKSSLEDIETAQNAVNTSLARNIAIKQKEVAINNVLGKQISLRTELTEEVSKLIQKEDPSRLKSSIAKLNKIIDDELNKGLEGVSGEGKQDIFSFLKEEGAGTFGTANFAFITGKFTSLIREQNSIAKKELEALDATFSSFIDEKTNDVDVVTKDLPKPPKPPKAPTLKRVKEQENKGKGTIEVFEDADSDFLAEIEKENKQEDELIIAQNEKKKQFRDDEFEALQEFNLNKFLLKEEDAEKVKDFEEQQEIDRLNRKLLFETGLTDIQRKAIESRIDLLQKEEQETNRLQSVGVAAAQTFANSLAQISTDSNKSAEENADERKAILLNGVRNTLDVALTEVLALLFADAVKKGGIFGLVGVPLILGGAKALFNTLIPRFEEGGVVGGNSTTGDNVLARVNSKEMILTQGQQANLFKMAQDGYNGGSNFDMSKVLNAQKETNELLKNQKGSVIHKNKLLITKNGMLTDDFVSLS